MFFHPGNINCVFHCFWHARLSLFKQLKQEINQVSKSSLRAFEITREAVKRCETDVAGSV